MHTSKYEVFAIEPFPTVKRAGTLLEHLASATTSQHLVSGDVVVLASKVVSIDEGRRVRLSDINPRDEAVELAASIGKDSRLIELILRESQSYRLASARGPIVAYHNLGYELTSAGVDRDGDDFAYLLPVDPDASAERLRKGLEARTGAAVAVVVADSDGRPDRAGATVIALGCAGVAPLRRTAVRDGKKRIKWQDETLVDLIAGAAGVVIGQRGRGAPVAVVRGVAYEGGADGVRSILHRG